MECVHKLDFTGYAAGTAVARLLGVRMPLLETAENPAMSLSPRKTKLCRLFARKAPARTPASSSCNCNRNLVRIMPLCHRSLLKRTLLSCSQVAAFWYEITSLFCCGELGSQQSTCEIDGEVLLVVPPT